MNILLAAKLTERGYKLTPKQKDTIQRPKPGHTHDWHIYSQYQGHTKNMQRYWVIVRGCPDCKEKHAVDLVSELPKDLSKYLSAK